MVRRFHSFGFAILVSEDAKTVTKVLRVARLFLRLNVKFVISDGSAAFGRAVLCVFKFAIHLMCVFHLIYAVKYAPRASA